MQPPQPPKQDKAKAPEQKDIEKLIKQIKSEPTIQTPQEESDYLKQWRALPRNQRDRLTKK
jgi:hypothetical protein